MPDIFEDLKLSRNLAYTFCGELFYKYAIGNYNGLDVNDDILLIYSDEMMSRLNQNRVWTRDGTFEVVPKPFNQIFTISYLR